MASHKLGWVLGSWLAGGLFLACGGTPDADADVDADADGTGGAVGAGGGSGDGSGGAGVAIPASKVSVCFDYVAAQCERRNECFGFEHENCSTYGRALCPDVLFSEGSPRTIESTLACAQEWREFPCSEILLWHVPDCSVPGTKAEGEECVFLQQCATGACSGDAYSCGVCIPVAESGAACQEGVTDCPASDLCQGNICTQREAPTPPPEPTLLAAGAACQYYSGDVCPTGTMCFMSDSVTAPACNPAPALNDPCALIVTDVYDCPQALYCDGTNHCIARPGDGQPCAENPNYTQICAAGTQCLLGTCRTPVALGEACTSAPCAEGICAEDGICKSLAHLGEACGALTECEAHTLCDAGSCVADDTLTKFTEICMP